MKIIIVCEKCFALYRNINIMACNICESDDLSEFEIEHSNKNKQPTKSNERKQS